MMSMATSRQDILLLKRACKLLLITGYPLYMHIYIYISLSLSLSLIFNSATFLHIICIIYIYSPLRPSQRLELAIPQSVGLVFALVPWPCTEGSVRFT